MGPSIGNEDINVVVYKNTRYSIDDSDRITFYTNSNLILNKYSEFVHSFPLAQQYLSIEKVDNLPLNDYPDYQFTSPNDIEPQVESEDLIRKTFAADYDGWILNNDRNYTQNYKGGYYYVESVGGEVFIKRRVNTSTFQDDDEFPVIAYAIMEEKDKPVFDNAIVNVIQEYLTKTDQYLEVRKSSLNSLERTETDVDTVRSYGYETLASTVALLSLSLISAYSSYKDLPWTAVGSSVLTILLVEIGIMLRIF